MSDQQYDINSKGILFFIRKWRTVLLLTCGIAFISSLVFSYFIEDKYESSVVVFPSTTSSISRALLNNENYKEKDFLQFGEEEEAEQMIQVLKSDQIKSHVIKKFNLMTHYGIDPSDEFKLTKLNREYNRNIDFNRTKFMSVKIEVLDKDPQYASDIANEIALMYDSVKNNMLRKVASQAYKIVESEFNQLSTEINRMEDTLNQIRKLGIQDYETQVEVLSEQYGAALVKNNMKAANILKSKLDTLSKYGGKYLSLVQQLEYEREKLSELRKVYSESRVNLNSQLDQKFVVNQAYPSDKPSYPIRWLIVIVSTIATFLFTHIILIIIDPKD